MKFGLRALLFVLAFQIQVGVKASAPQAPMSSPARCELSVGECFVQTGARVWRAKQVDLHLEAEPESVLRRIENQWGLLQGSLRVRLSSKGEMKFRHGRLSAEAESEFWLLTQGEDRFVVRAIRHPLNLQMRDGRQVEIPEGFEIWVSGLRRDGRNAHGVPVEIPVEDHLRRWARLNDSPKADFLKDVENLKARWKERHATASFIYEKVVQRHLASVKQQELEVESRRQAERQRQNEMKKLLFRQAFEK